MSISQELRRAGPYISDGSTKAFTFSFKVMKGSDLSVVVADNKDTSVSETLASTNYTVTLNDNQENSPGGTVTLDNALPSGKALAILSNALSFKKRSLPMPGASIRKFLMTLSTL